MDYVIDRFEDSVAVCQNLDDEKMQNIDISLIDGNVNEGDIITFENGRYYLNKSKTDERKKTIKKKFDSLWG